MRVSLNIKHDSYIVQRKFIGNAHVARLQVIYCAFMRLSSLPYFLDFKAVWQELDVSENFISGLPSDGFRSVRVRHLRFGRNSIESVAPDAFASGPNELIRLDLSHNQLESLPPGVFRPLAELRSLSLQYNRLTVKGLRRVFDDIPHLHELDLQVSERFRFGHVT
jgi:Leucine rich repeat